MEKVIPEKALTNSRRGNLDTENLSIRVWGMPKRKRYYQPSPNLRPIRMNRKQTCCCRDWTDWWLCVMVHGVLLIIWSWCWYLPRRCPEPSSTSVTPWIFSLVAKRWEERSVLFFQFFGHTAQYVGSSFPWPGIEPTPLALEAWSLNHWITKEVPKSILEAIWNSPWGKVWPWRQSNFWRN